MQYSQEHLKTMVYAKFGGQTECIMGNWKIENGRKDERLENKNNKSVTCGVHREAHALLLHQIASVSTSCTLQALVLHFLWHAKC